MKNSSDEIGGTQCQKINSLPKNMLKAWFPSCKFRIANIFGPLKSTILKWIQDDLFFGDDAILFQGFLQRSVKCLRFKSGHLRSPKASPRSRWSNSSSRWSLLRSLRSKNSMALPWSVAGRPTKSTGENKKCNFEPWGERAFGCNKWKDFGSWRTSQKLILLFVGFWVSS